MPKVIIRSDWCYSALTKSLPDAQPCVLVLSCLCSKFQWKKISKNIPVEKNSSGKKNLFNL